MKRIAATSLALALCAPAMLLAEPAPAAQANAAATAVDSAAALIGQAPPPIKVAKWIKGEPLEKFEPGKVYVVDFWATWCGPCKAAIPHLTELQKKHAGKVEVIGVSISERQKDPTDVSYIDGVVRFVEKQGEFMDYRVAVDTPDKVMHATWFKPTGTGGIPTAYIIDQSGKTVWTGIGSPAVIERIVGEVLAGTFDPKVEAEKKRRFEAEAAQRAQRDAANPQEPFKQYPGFDEAMKRGDKAAALECLNAAFKADPQKELRAGHQMKFQLLMSQGNKAAVEGYGRDLLERYPDNAEIASWVSAVLVSTDDTLRYDAKLALTAAEKSLAMSKPDSRWQQFAKWRLAWAQFHVGEKDKAIATIKDAIASIDRLKDTHDFGDLATGCKQSLATFQKSQ